ncbi:TonB-dependent receptor [Echinicola jeungdonensis]|uniref:SusC/RagA family TonB-linked outer membrane protein n=1 Tax=Echinicola jeungdonensis TaxID=709343 RepID=A0ABV5J9I7_9BACT|nr:TonB-dependent receptor [Echinicola jeungdonensis]MDN3670428.1 TonB-dependent receptor [Echinicola jeungdonensis]
MQKKIPIKNWHWKCLRLVLCLLLFNGSLARESKASNSNYFQQKELSNVYLSLDLQKVGIIKVFKAIESKTGFGFAYDEEKMIGVGHQTIQVNNESLLKVLEGISFNTDLRFKSVNNTIYVKSQEKNTEPKSAVERTISGVVVSAEDGNPIPGATVLVKGTTIGTATNLDGEFSLDIPENPETVIVVSFVGFKPQEIKVQNKSVFNVTLHENLEGLDEVVVVGFGEQRKGSLVSSVSTVKVEDLKIPSSNLTNALAGKVAGVISFQTSGEPGLGTDNSNFFIRGLSTFGSGKRNPLIMIDGIESTPVDMARLQPDDIADFSVLKDAAASSIYGARGANGVVLINTKSGKAGPLKVSFRVENRLSTNTRNINLADNITYMEMANEATLTRSPNAIPTYSQNKINATRAGENPYLYPNNDWIDQLIKDYTFNQGYNINMSGGGPKGRYYLAATYNRDNGNLKVDPINNFNSNIRLNNYSIRSNVDFNLTPTTKLTARVYGQFDDYNGPIGGGSATFNNALWANPVMFPAVYPQEKLPFIEHPLFGSAPTINSNAQATSTLYVNPYAEMVKGYQTYKTSNINPQLELNQDLDMITEGLKVRAMTYLKRYSLVSLNRFYNPFYYQASINSQDGSYSLNVLNDGGTNSIGTPGTEYLNYTEDEKLVESTFWLQGVIDYNRIFDQKHSVGGMLVSYIQHYEAGNPGSLIRSLPNRNLGVSGRFTYGYDDRYLVELNFGYNGSERFSEDHRFGFFPSAGFGYVISNEDFFTPLRGAISNLKFRATYGIVGNDQIGNRDERFLYLSNVNLNDGAYGAVFGKDDGAAPYYRNGVSISRYANENITWEQSEQINLGMDLGLMNNSMQLVVDAFKQTRTQILQPLTYIDNASGLMATPMSNYGKAESKGVDLSLNYNKTVSKDLNVEVRGTFTYATSKAIKVDELNYQEGLGHLTRTGYPLSQQWGYIAERLFIDEEEVANSPVQFGNTELMAGDIKYRDITGDGVINSDDVVPIGYPTQPEIIYGIGSSINYKNFDFNFYFQGSARSSFFIDPWAIQPFYQNGGYQNGLLQVIADDYWSTGNPNPYAFWPRLSTARVSPNNQRSTWWMRNGSFVRLKNASIGYNLGPIESLGIKSGRIYLSGINLFSISKFNLWDVEMGGNGLNYPIQTVYNLGLSINL